MKKKTTFLGAAVITALFVAVGFVQAADSSLATKLSGRILLQVEEKGEAWYINPQSRQRHYLRNGEDALKLMREQGVGISNEAINMIPLGDLNLAGKLDSDGDGLSDALEDALGTDKFKRDTDGDGYDDKTELLNGYSPFGTGRMQTDNSLAVKNAGKIFLQVHRNGEAWYINPLDHKRYFLGGPEDAYNLMRQLGLGISNENLNKIPRYGGQAASSAPKNDSGSSGNNDNKAPLSNDAFYDRLSTCAVGENSVMNQTGTLPFIGLKVAWSNAVKIKEPASDGQCVVETKILTYDIDREAALAEFEEALEELKEDLAVDLNKSVAEVSILFATPIANISPEDRAKLIEAELDIDFSLVTDTSITLSELLIYNAEGYMNTFAEEVFDGIIGTVNVCTGNPASLKSFLTDASSSSSADCSTDMAKATCTYPGGVTCVSEVKTIE